MQKYCSGLHNDSESSPRPCFCSSQHFASQFLFLGTSSTCKSPILVLPHLLARSFCPMGIELAACLAVDGVHGNTAGVHHPASSHKRDSSQQPSLSCSSALLQETMADGNCPMEPGVQLTPPLTDQTAGRKLCSQVIEYWAHGASCELTPRGPHLQSPEPTQSPSEAHRGHFLGLPWNILSPLLTQRSATWCARPSRHSGDSVVDENFR